MNLRVGNMDTDGGNASNPTKASMQCDLQAVVAHVEALNKERLQSQLDDLVHII